MNNFSCMLHMRRKIIKQLASETKYESVALTWSKALGNHSINYEEFQKARSGKKQVLLHVLLIIFSKVNLHLIGTAG